MPKHKATCLPNDRRISVDEEENLLQAAMEAGIHINASCGGSATCGKCKVKILKGVVDSPKHPKLTQWEYDQGFRLACLTPIRDNLEVEIPIESQVDRSVLTLKVDREAYKYLLSPQDIYQLVKGWEEDPAVFKRYAQLEPPTLKDNVSDLTHLINALDRQHGIEGISADFRAIMLSNHPIFINEFIAAMFLPRTDASAFPRVTEKPYRMKRQVRSERMVEGRL
jgi:uncharacterized 2Fe-2S/4Fe-4S cluster protein (DUF4445 family)